MCYACTYLGGVGPARTPELREQKHMQTMEFADIPTNMLNLVYGLEPNVSSGASYSQPLLDNLEHLCYTSSMEQTQQDLSHFFAPLSHGVPKPEAERNTMEQNGIEFSDAEAGFNENQLAAIPYLVAAPTMAEGAQLANIGRSTLYRWMNNHKFRSTLERLREEAADLAHTELRGLMLKGAHVLAKAMEDPNSHVRVRTARAALSLGLKTIDLKELQQRIERLDDAFALWARRKAF